MRDKYLFGISYTGDTNTDKILTEAIDGSDTSFQSGKDWAGFSEPSHRFWLNFNGFGGYWQIEESDLQNRLHEWSCQ